jgi:hypothetical protein
MNFDTYVQTITEVEKSSYIKDNEQYYKDLNSDVFSFLHRSFDDVFQILQNDKFFILSSIAGAGKTVTFEQLAMRMKKKISTSWISYIDLKDHTNLYKICDTIEDVKELLIKILKIKSQSKFENALFENFFEKGHVVLLWNGFDEISPTYSQEVLETIRKIRTETQNIQLVCTRPLYSAQLRDFFEVKPYQLLPYNENEQREFLTKFYSLNVDKTYKSSDFVLKSNSTILQDSLNSTDIDVFIDKVRESINKLSVKGVTSESLEFSRDFNTPLMLILLGESFLDDRSLLKFGVKSESVRKYRIKL